MNETLSLDENKTPEGKNKDHAKDLFGSLRTVLRAGLHAFRDTVGVEGTADDVVPYAGQILHSAATNEHDAVFLQVVPHTGDINRSFHLVDKTDTRDLTKRRVGLLGSSRLDRQAYAALLRVALEQRRNGFLRARLAALSDELVDSGHVTLPPF